MNRNVKKKWVDALRRPIDEGGYVQTTEALWERRPRKINGKTMQVDCFCALGVLVNIAAEEGVASWDDVNDLRSMFIPMNVKRWADLSENEAWDIGTANDEGKKFPEIADMIEADL